MGAVYLALDERLHRGVALKVVARRFADDDRFRRRFLRESQAAASPDHPHVVPIYAAGEQDGVLFLAMRYIERPDLCAPLHADERVQDAHVIGLVDQIAGALDAAHERGLVHLDVKPANILLAGGVAQYAYLCDFGLARRAANPSTLTGEGFLGTVAYTAPEQIEGAAVDGRVTSICWAAWSMSV